MIADSKLALFGHASQAMQMLWPMYSMHVDYASGEYAYVSLQQAGCTAAGHGCHRAVPHAQKHVHTGMLTHTTQRLQQLCLWFGRCRV